jgi:hypothetical protein
MQSLIAAESVRLAPICKVTASEGHGLSDLLAQIRSASIKRDSEAQRIEAWSFRLQGILRDHFLELVNADELRRHSEKVSKGIEDPYAAIAALARSALQASASR